MRAKSTLKVLDFDIETRKVGFHTGGRFSPDGCEPTAIACSWYGEEKVHCWLQPRYSVEEMLENFLDFYNAAGIVSGHYIKKFDLPILNAALMEARMPLLDSKLVSDTKTDLVRRAGLSASQENLSGMYGISQDKFHMGDHTWRESTRLTERGIRETKKRVMDDVRQHKALRARLIEAGALGAPRMWRP